MFGSLFWNALLILIVWFSARWYYKKQFAPPEYKQYRHLKRDSVYNLISIGMMQVSEGDAPNPRNLPARVVTDGMPLVIYASVNVPGMYFIRFPDEFEDTNRFRPVE